jgi:hypothetical protein
MGTTVQILPGVLFAAEVLGPEWGREYQQTPTAAQSKRASTAKEGSTKASTSDALSLLEGDARESGQIALL